MAAQDKTESFDPAAVFKAAEAELARGEKRQTEIKAERVKLDDEYRKINERSEVLRRIVGAKEKRTHKPKTTPAKPDQPVTKAQAGVAAAVGSANGPID